jgi:hypothetical protein
LVGGSKTTVTLRFPQAGHINRDSSLDNGKFGPRVLTSVSKTCKGLVYRNLTFGPAWRMTGASDFLSPFDNFHQLQILKN